MRCGSHRQSTSIDHTGPMARRLRACAVLLLLALGPMACGTRVQEVASTSPSTVIVERTVAPDGSPAPASESAAPGTDPDASTAAPAGGSATAAGGAAAAVASAAPSGDNVVASAGCPAQATGDPIELGSVGTQSGIIGAALENAFRGLAVWQQWVNAHGGVQCRPVDITFVDDAADPGKHAAAVRRLIRDDGVVAFIGNIAPFTFSAGAPILEQNQIPALGGEAADSGWFNSPVAFPINGQTISRSRPAAKWAISHLPQRKAATIFVNEADAPARLASNFADEWRNQGGEIVLEAGVSLVTPDFTSEVLEAKNRGAEVLYLVLEQSACTRWFNAQRRQRYEPIILSTACTLDNARAAKDILAGKFYALHAARPVRAPDSPAQAEILDAIAQYDPSLPPDGAFMFGWLAGLLFQEAMAQDGAQLTGPGIIDALHRLPATDLGGLTPTQAWPPGPHAEGTCGMVSSFDGESLHLETPEFIC